MLTFSQDGPTADKQMRAVIFYLTTFGYIDGDFDASEKDFVREYIRKLEAGGYDPTVGTLQRIAKALGVPLMELLG